MAESSLNIKDQVVVREDQLQGILDALAKAGYNVIGPTVRDRAVALDHLTSLKELPKGWTDEHNPGSYRLVKRSDEAYFGYVLGPYCWKKFLFPPQAPLWQAKKAGVGFQMEKADNALPKTAFFGVRSCELHAITMQDKILTQGEFLDPIYKERREKIFIVAVNCAEAKGTCFCVSMKTGPKAESGFDISLTEIIDKKNHYFLVEVGSKTGAEILGKVSFEKADQEAKSAADKATSTAVGQMGRLLDTKGIKELLYANREHPRWDEVATRCLSCTNCTLVCPTCFCMNVNDSTDLTGNHTERNRRWDSCFTLEHSYIHGGSIRVSAKSRYRQWLTHKLASWIDQFGDSGCVGCGRCITWCPAGIDITEEVRAIRESGKVAKAAATKE